MSFLPFFMIILASIVFSSLFSRFHLPWVLALIAAGMLIGPFGFSLVEDNPTLSFMGEIGLLFLMFIAGLQTNLKTFSHFERDIGIITVLNGLIPFVVGFSIGYVFDFSLLASVLLGTIFMSSSIAVVIPALERKGVMQRKIGRAIMSTTMVNDIASLVILSVLLQQLDPATNLPIWSFYILLVALLIGLRYGLPKIRSLFPRFRDEQDLFESEVRLIFAMLFGTVILFEAVGLHPIIAGFFSGLVLSDSLTSEILMQKIHTIGYGIFIPIFFIMIGVTTDLGVVVESAANISLAVAIVIGSVAAKFGSGYLGSTLAGYSRTDASFIGFATIPQLSTTLAVVVTATSLELVPPSLLSAMVILSIVSTMIAPTAMRLIPLREY